jgi:hypothetical protein
LREVDVRRIRVWAALLVLMRALAAAGPLDQDESARADVLALVGKPAPALEASVWFGPNLRDYWLHALGLFADYTDT